MLVSLNLGSNGTIALTFPFLAVGFTFHACLLMVLILWKPIEDDPALFYVISAAWGVCNAIWEMLNFSKYTVGTLAFTLQTCVRLS